MSEPDNALLIVRGFRPVLPTECAEDGVRSSHGYRRLSGNELLSKNLGRSVDWKSQVGCTATLTAGE